MRLNVCFSHMILNYYNCFTLVIFLTGIVLREKKEARIQLYCREGKFLMTCLRIHQTSTIVTYLTARVQIKPQDFCLVSVYFFIMESV